MSTLNDTSERFGRVEHDRIGGPEVLIWRSAALPSPAAGEVRIAMRAASVNPIDGKIRSGLLSPLPLQFPATTGRDGMGEVVALGPGVDAEWLGRRVAFLSPRGGQGTWAEAVTMPVAVLAAVPQNVPDLAAAALPLVGLSAAAVLNLGGCLSDKRVLVHAASGGVGRIAVQLALNAGAHVEATASAASRAALEAMGVSRVWSYDDEDFTQTHDIDLVVDLLGGEIHARSYAVLRRGGTLACLNAAPFVDRSNSYGVSTQVANVLPDPVILAELLQRVADGHLDAGPTQVLPIGEFVQAHQIADAGKLRGKLVLDFGV